MKRSLSARHIVAFAVTLAMATPLVACGQNATNSAPDQQSVTETTVDTTEDVSAETTAEPEQDTQATTESDSAPRRFIIDTDTGADDASALIYAASQKNCKIEGVTVLMGNVDLEQGTKNALMALELVGCDAPVYKGADTTYDGEDKVAFSVFGADGMGEADLVHPTATAQDGDAVDFILDTVRDNPGEIEILCLGPATNIARAIEKDPEAMKQVKMIWSMGTSGLGPGNASPVAEFNVYSDALAYKKLMDADLPTTVVGLDMCDGDAMWTDEQFDELKELNETGKFVESSFNKIREFYADNGSEGTVMNCDTVATICALNPDAITDSVNCHGSCIADAGETYGQVLFYKEGFTYDAATNDFDYNVRLVTGVDKPALFDAFKAAISA